MPSGLGPLIQQDYAAGMFRSVARHLIPANGCYDLQNYLLDEDGSPYRRGGSLYKSTADFGSGLTSMWEVHLVPGPRTVIANADDFGVLDAAEAPINLGGTGLDGPARAVELAGLLYIPGGTGTLYAGSRKTAPYTTGTVSVTQNSATVTGSGTTWNTLVDAGMIFALTSGRPYVVKSVDSTTQITLDRPFVEATASGQAYSLYPLYTLASPSTVYAVAASRLWRLIGDTAFASARNDPTTFNEAEDFIRLPDGSQVIGGVELRDELLLFATSGLHVLQNILLDPTDAAGNPQWRRSHLSTDMILWSNEGLATWAGSVVAPCADGIWLLDGVGPPTRISRSIEGIYRTFVAAGYRTGTAAVHRGHYYLPILNTDNEPVETLVCRLDRPVSVRGLGTVYPWARLRGFSGRVAAFAVRTGTGATVRDPRLLAASDEGRVLDCNSFYGPALTAQEEPDGSDILTSLDTRDYATGDGVTANVTRRVLLRRELKGAGSTISGFYSLAGDEESLGSVAAWDIAEWDVDVWPGGELEEGGWVPLDGLAGTDDGRGLHSWPINKRSRFIRYRFRSSDAASKMVVRTIESRIRPTSHR